MGVDRNLRIKTLTGAGVAGKVPRAQRGAGVKWILLLALLTLTSACFRGLPSDKPPIHINPNMDDQPKYKPQSASQFFVDGATMREPVPGTVPRGFLREDQAYYFGRDARGDTLKHVPVPITMQLLKRGQQRFNIYCSPCHSRVGDGKGIVVQYNFLPPPTFHSDRLRNVPDGYIFSVITNGIRNMPSYRHQISVADRWAIVAYVRALQRSQHATLDDLPEEIRSEYESEFEY
ncbi:MAG: cytochrome c [Calditrichaeota bacterium]|nr:MAG: cytochrome c [Calditrichota bacterium]